MKHRDDELDQVLDRTLAEIREDAPDRQFEQAATDRVWQRLSGEIATDEVETPGPSAGIIRSCADFQSLIPDYLDGRLPQARHLLLKDHLSECVPCRRALKDRQRVAGPVAAPSRTRKRSFLATAGWRAAAAAVLFVTLVGFGWKGEVFSFESGGMIRIDEVEGELFQLTDEGTVPLKSGDVVQLEKGQGIRTAKGPARS